MVVCPWGCDSHGCVSMGLWFSWLCVHGVVVLMVVVMVLMVVCPWGCGSHGCGHGSHGCVSMGLWFSWLWSWFSWLCVHGIDGVVVLGLGPGRGREGSVEGRGAIHQSVVDFFGVRNLKSKKKKKKKKKILENRKKISRE